MSRLIRTGDLLDGFDVRRVTEYDETGCGMQYNAVPVEVIENAPTVDAVEVIRCGRCAYYGKSPFGSRELGWCRIDAKHRPPNYYCANADETKKSLSADRMEDTSK